MTFFPIPAFLRRRRKKAKEGFAINRFFFIDQVFRSYIVALLLGNRYQKCASQYSQYSKCKTVDNGPADDDGPCGILVVNYYSEVKCSLNVVLWWLIITVKSAVR